MIITKRALPRRTILRGLGVTLALPWLESMVPALTALSQTTAAPPRRFGVFYVPNGMSMGYWLPETEGALDVLPPTLQALQPHKDRALLLGGMAQAAAAKVLRSGAHARSSGVFLNCVPFTGSEATVVAETTMDQLVAKEWGKDTQLTSLELGIESAAILGACDGVSCALTNTIAWSSPTTPLPIDNDPRSVFERLFGLSGSTDPEARLARIQRDRSILDVLVEHAARLNTRLAPRDRVKFDEYLEAVRDVERRIQKAEEQNSRELPVVDQPVGIPNDYAEHAELMTDLLALAYQTDLTRVSTFMMAREVSSRAYPEIGVADSHHPLSHHSNDVPKLERLHKINEYHFRQVARLIDRLSKLDEGDGTILDHCLFLYGTGISDSNTHFYDDLPIALIAGKSTGVTGGRYVRYAPGTPLANLHLTLLDEMGLPLDRFGDSTGRLSQLAV